MPHRFASQIGGLLGLLLLLWQIFKTTVGPVRSVYGAAICVSAMVLAMTLPAAGAPIYVLALLAGIALFGLDRLGGRPNIGAALGFGLMLPNVLFLRQSQFLGPDLSWHLFHIVIALWLVLTVLALTPRQVAASANTSSAA